jgi:hypothetical protein
MKFSLLKFRLLNDHCAEPSDKYKEVT